MRPVNLFVSLILASASAYACGSIERTAEDPRIAAKKGGIGAMVRADAPTGALAVDKVAVLGAAAAAGVKPNDLIWSIDGAPVTGVALEDLVDRLRGPVGSKVSLKVGSSSDEARDIVVTRAEPPQDVLDCQSGDCTSGTGVSVDIWGERYEGGFKDGRYEGQGKLVEPGGRSFEGTFVAGAANGQGVLVNAQGARFEGTFERGYPVGVVTIKMPNGDFYEGETRDFLMHGQGRLRRPSNSDLWEGHYELGKLVHGTWLHNPDGGDGRSCLREVHDGVLDATGTITYAANDKKKRVTFVGAFGDDCVANGEGLMSYKRSKMQGPFANDEPQKGAKTVR